MKDTAPTWKVRLSYHRPASIQPVTLAASYGSGMTAVDVVVEMFGCVPFPWQVYFDVLDTPTGLEKRIKRMHSPEKLFAARQKRIKKRLREKDPMFYKQLVGPALENDSYTLEFYRDRKNKIEGMHRGMSIAPENVGKLWIHPDAEKLKEFDWPGMALELQELVVKMDIYEAQDLLLKDIKKT